MKITLAEQVQITLNPEPFFDFKNEGNPHAFSVLCYIPMTSHDTTHLSMISNIVRFCDCKQGVAGIETDTHQYFLC